MSKPGVPKGPFTKWVDHGYDGWSWTDHETLEAAVHDEVYTGTWVIMKAVKYEIVEIPPPTPAAGGGEMTETKDG